MSYCFLSVGTVGAVRCVRTINSVTVFVETYVSCNDAYSCTITRAIVKVVFKYFNFLSVFVWLLPSIRSVSACLLEFYLFCVRLLTLSFIMFLMWLSGTRLHSAHQVTARRSSFGELVCLFIAPMSCVSFIHLTCTVSASLVSALWQSVMDLLLCILLERACSADRLSLQKVICWLLKVISSSAACLMAAVLAWETVQ